MRFGTKLWLKPCCSSKKLALCHNEIPNFETRKIVPSALLVSVSLFPEFMNTLSGVEAHKLIYKKCQVLMITESSLAYF